MTQSFTPAELQDFVSAVRPIARAASAAILRVYETDFAVESKDDHSPLTQADLASHRLICAALARLSSKLPVLSEESASVPFEERLRWQRYWLVDPLDGTKEFVKRNGEFTVNIALIDDHCPVVGVVDVPTLETVYYAARGVGSFKQVREGTPERLATRPLRLSEVALVGSRSHASGRAQTFVDSFGPSARLLTIGSSLKFCMVAEGSADVYPRFGPTSEWDSAAAQCVVEQAGGGVLGLDLKPLRYNTKAELLNPDFLVVGDPNFDWRSRIEH